MTWSHVRGVIFDVDGVLLDARASYHAVAEEAARRAVAEVIGEPCVAPFDREREIPSFKAAGRFNDDWEMARGIALLLHLRQRGASPELQRFLDSARGGGVAGLAGALPSIAPLYPQERVSRLCGALYGGRSHCRELFGFEADEALPDAPERGLWEREELLADCGAGGSPPLKREVVALQHRGAVRERPAGSRADRQVSEVHRAIEDIVPVDGERRGAHRSDIESAAGPRFGCGHDHRDRSSSERR